MDSDLVWCTLAPSICCIMIRLLTIHCYEESDVNIVLVLTSLVKHQMFLLVKVCILNTEI